MEAITDTITSLDPIWMYLATLLSVAVDGVFPPVPGESIVVALAALAKAGDSLNPFLLLLIAAMGAIIGDNIAYSFGRQLGSGRFKVMRKPRVTAALGRAHRGLEKRPASFLVTARFVPVVRVAVNVAAGATGVRRRKFVALNALACSAWATYTVLIGTIAGSWFGGNPLLAALAAVVAALILGWLIDLIFNLRRRQRTSAYVPSTTGVRPGSEPVRHTTFSSVGR